MASPKEKAGKSRQAALRSLPSVEELLETEALKSAMAAYGRGLVVLSARAVIGRLRQDIISGKTVPEEILAPEHLGLLIQDESAAIYYPSLKRLVNATGVVVHTNLGRSVLAPEAIEAVAAVAGSYSNLEYSLEKGARGSRHDHIERIITALTGAEAALVVNNNAAAVLLALAAFAAGREVVVSRGELIEIGGSFRIPEIMAASSARLVEVGTTNKTKLADYQKAIGTSTSMLLHIHTSNFKIVGFTAEVPIAELSALAHEHGLIVMDDLGSGALAGPPVLAGEPSVADSLAAGADIVTFSGDKLLGGPQAGIVVGKAGPVKKMKSHPMARALRVDKMTLAALQATLSLYLKPEEAMKRIPTLRMLGEPEADIENRAAALAGSLAALGSDLATQVEKAAAKVGGGALPLLELDSYVCAISPASLTAEQLAGRLRRTDPPVVGRIHKGRLLLDARTILPGETEEIVSAMKQALSQK